LPSLRPYGYQAKDSPLRPHSSFIFFEALPEAVAVKSRSRRIISQTERLKKVPTPEAVEAAPPTALPALP